VSSITILPRIPAAIGGGAGVNSSFLESNVGTTGTILAFNAAVSYSYPLTKSSNSSSPIYSLFLGSLDISIYFSIFLLTPIVARSALRFSSILRSSSISTYFVSF
jgi:hypothetical protein